MRVSAWKEVALGIFKVGTCAFLLNNSVYSDPTASGGSVEIMSTKNDAYLLGKRCFVI